MEYLTRHDYNVKTDWEAHLKRKKLQEYQDKIFFHHYKIDLKGFRPKYKYATSIKDERGIDVSIDVSDRYPMTLEDEKVKINKIVEHLNFLRDVKDNFEYCRARCKIMDARIRLLDAYPREHQMCLTDCVNIRTELYGPDIPKDSKKNFIWIG